MNIFKFLLPICLVTVLFANGDFYLSKDAVLYTDSNNKVALGELIVASKVKELSANGNKVEVEFQGYVPEGSTIAYEKFGILMVGFEAIDASKYKVIGQKKDEYDTVWLHVSIKGFVQKDVLAKDKAKILDAGKALFQAKCGVCHELHSPSEFDANVWPSILKAMGVQAGLSKFEKYSIGKYLQNYKHK